MAKNDLSTGKCGHINKHSKDIQGNLDNLVCEKDKGHDGNHGAKHLQHVKAQNGVLLIGKNRFSEDKVWVEWGADAGILASKITPQYVAPTDEDLQRIKIIKDLAGGDIPAGTQFG